MRPSHTDLSDLSVFAGEVAGPEDVGTGGHAAALIWLLEEAGGDMVQAQVNFITLHCDYSVPL